ncbi:MAG TPA: hemerythrin domain-containing protein [Acidimicrobiales bacterium]|jgi:hemerythrin superfamily protein|nr:hemerythrin domain-containing protein [Acidimicrobiales bacterium]
MTYTPGIDRSRVDLLTQLLADHREVEDLFGEWDRTAPDQREAYFCALVPVLVGHEVAEEMVVFPALGGVDEMIRPVIDERLEEQASAEDLLAQMEKMDPASGAFATAFDKLRQSVLAHAEAEEQQVFPLLDQQAEVLDRPTLGIRYEKAKAAAPTHPHPHAPSTPPGNLVLGPIAAMADRVRDAVR